MKRRTFPTLAGVLLIAAAVAQAEDSLWMTDLAQAKEFAAQRKVPILVQFAGTDWCGWCKKLGKEVLSEPAFKDFAKDNLVLVLADFPARKQMDPRSLHKTRNSRNAIR